LNECVQCGQCINRCPTGALSEKGEIEDVLAQINNPKKMVVFQTAPAIRVAIAEEFGYEPGEKMAKNELAQGLKMLG
jgi:iron only hydrogenase large subunit-like protein